MNPIRITVRQGGKEVFTVVTDDAEDGIVVEVNGEPVVAIDLMYSGLAVGGGEPYEPLDDPADATNTPKIVVGTWPDGEQWERLHSVPMTTFNEPGAFYSPLDPDGDRFLPDSPIQ